MTTRRKLVQGIASLILLVWTGAMVYIIVGIPDDPARFWLNVMAWFWGGLAVLVIVASLYAVSWKIIGWFIKKVGLDGPSRWFGLDD